VILHRPNFAVLFLAIAFGGLSVVDFDAPLPIRTFVSLRSDRLTSPTGGSFLVAATATAGPLSTAKKVGRRKPPFFVFFVPTKERKKSQEVVEKKIVDPLILLQFRRPLN
jgi:hypothetical protein